MPEQSLTKLSEINIDDVTPGFKQYIEVKQKYPDCILFYRLGDFYEMFFDDAVIASRELELTLTAKACGLELRAAMCGIPYHAYENNMNRLVENGYKVAICEQVEDPKLAKGLVKREVIRIVTPGTNISAQSLEESKNNYLMSLYYTGDVFGLSFVDVSTGDFHVTECETAGRVLDEINAYAPSEIVCNAAAQMSGVDLDLLRKRDHICISSLDESFFDEAEGKKLLCEHFKVDSIEKLGLSGYEFGVISAAAVLRFLYETQMISLEHITSILPYVNGRYMIIDNSTRRNLELCETLREKNRRGSLLWVVDKTKTAMGARMLRTFIEQPMLDKEDIEDRLDAVEELKNAYIDREEIREYLNTIYDLERLAGRISYRNANPRDLIAFASSLEMLPAIRLLCEQFKSKLLCDVYEKLDPLQDIRSLIVDAIIDDPPVQIKEGGIFKTGFNAEIDSLRNAKSEGKNWLADLETKERDRTGIKNLKVKFSRNFGYCLEVTNSFKNLVPGDWTRRQTLTGAERYTTAELKELEDKIVNAESRLFALEYDLFTQIREQIAANIARIQQTAKAIALLDSYASIAYVAERNNFVRPSINTDGVINIKNGRHPVVEQFIGADSFVANDTYLDNKNSRIAIITGPNMAGKSTYMRQTALIVLMAQCGFFVPAESADIGIVDRIFTRVGASDDLASGQSTFMVEMNEVAYILKNATSKSLLILDEIGRGTSTFDGLGIAWAVVEYISSRKQIGAKTLFATHYHELTELEDKLESVNNYCIAVKEQGEDIIFLRKIIRGGADRSYGIQVARLAGLPEAVLARAREIVDILTDNDINGKIRENVDVITAKTRSPKKAQNDLEAGQMSLFDAFGGGSENKEVIDKLKSIKVDELRPVEALNLLAELQGMIKE
ncbi:MAG: DNA mismatch repair protein MutS [Lachnospiraceae bacterium]|nr:DNA mismatch repair protein MutS [Lachnospiraceae bacterium]